VAEEEEKEAVEPKANSQCSRTIVCLLLDHSAENAAMFSGAIVCLLLDHSADVCSRSNAGWTPLHLAAAAGRETIVRVLLHKGADLRFTTYAGRTAVSCVLLYAHNGVVAILRKEADRRETKYRVTCEAFAMGHLERLGVDSRVRFLEVEVVRMILEQL
jgi:hypothetical protein